MSNRDDTPSSNDLPLVNEPALWEAVRAGDLAIRECLIDAYLPYARTLSASLFAARFDDEVTFNEYVQFASIALIEAVDSYDHARGALFTTFAYPRIHGAILGGIAHYNEKRTQIATRKEVARKRKPAVAALPAQDCEDIFQNLADVAISLALGFILDDASSYAHDETTLQQYYSGTELRQLRERVRALVEGLPPKERLVIKHHHFNQLTFESIAPLMALTPSRVSQIHKKALMQLRIAAKSVKDYDVAW